MLKGSIVALVTPFNADGSVNYDELGKLIDYHCDNNSGGIVILGTTGEASTLSLSIRINFLTPERASASSAVPPTPPTPITKITLLAKAPIFSFPSSCSDLSK